jgi:hypothetical protein
MMRVIMRDKISSPAAQTQGKRGKAWRLCGRACVC